MSLVATLVSPPMHAALHPSLVAEACQAVKALDRKILAAECAVDLFLPEDCPAPSAMRRLREVLGEAPVDIAIVPAEGRRKKLLVADMDSTMIGQECIDELAAMIGLKEKVAAITERAMRGEIAFEPALRERVALLAGLPLTIIEEVLASRITVTPGALPLIRTMRAHGAHTALVSGGFTVFTGAIAAQIGFHEHHANHLLAEDGVLAGRVAEPILGREAKKTILEALRRAQGLQTHETLAIGDGANDLGMIQVAGLGVAYHAKPAVAAMAHAEIRHGDLTTLLFFQGFSAEEIMHA